MSEVLAPTVVTLGTAESPFPTVDMRPANSVGKRVLKTLGWLLLLLVPLVGIWVILRPFFDSRPSRTLKLGMVACLVAAIILTVAEQSALAGVAGVLNWALFIYATWRTTDAVR
jgi:nicotinamide riboside transporter PnuC